MTEDEKQRWRDLKADTASVLGSHDHAYYLKEYGYALDDTDSRMSEYAFGVIDNPDGHNLYEILALKRFFDMLDRHGWNVKRVRKFIRFYEALRFNGTKGRQRYKLTPVQTFQFANIFGFKDDEGNRLIRTAYIFVPRKFSKTTSAASLAVYDMLFGDNNAQVYVGANSYEQAKICFDEIRAIMRDIDPSERHFQVNREKITFKDKGRDSLIRCLTSNAKTQDGLYASLVIMDEYAQARNTAGKNGADLKNVLTSSMGPRKEPLTLIITTASDVIDGPFVGELEGVKKVLRGEDVNDRIFAALFMPDVDDAEDDPNTWHKVQPHLGITVRNDFYENEYANAKLSAENMLSFRNKQLNIFAVNEKKSWFSYEKAKEIIGDFDIDRVEGHPLCAVAFDLSVHDDFSAVCYTIYSNLKKCFYSHVDYYFPEGALKGHQNEQLYRKWHEDGYLKYCDGDCIDVARIADDILSKRNVTIIRIGYDAYKSQELVNRLSAAGASAILTPFSQTYGSFNLPVESFELLCYKTPPRIMLNDNPMNAYCLTNCLIDTDRLENKKPIKISQNRKIDGVITLLMTLGLLYSIER